MSFLALYDRPDAGPYERHLVRLARTWLRLMKADFPAQRIVDGMLAELADPKPEGYGCGWDELREKFTAWAIAEEWIKPGGGARSTTRSKVLTGAAPVGKQRAVSRRQGRP